METLTLSAQGYSVARACQEVGLSTATLYSELLLGAAEII